MVILTFDPSPQPAIERLQACCVLGAEQREKLHADRPEESLYLSPPLRHVRPAVNQGYAELGAHQFQVVRAVHGAVVHVQALAQSPTADGLLQDGKKGRRVFRKSEGRERHHPRRIVNERDQIRLVPPLSLDGYRHRVHHVAHPQLVRLLEGEVPPVFARRLLGTLRHQPLPRQQPVHCRGRQFEIGWYLTRGPCGIDHHPHRQFLLVLLEHTQKVGHLLRDRPCLPLIRTRLRAQSLETALAPRAQPASQGLGCDSGAARAWDRVAFRRLLLEPGVRPRFARLHVGQIGDQSVAEERHIVTSVGRCFGLHDFSPRTPCLGPPQTTTGLCVAGQGPLPVGCAFVFATAVWAGDRIRRAAPVSPNARPRSRVAAEVPALFQGPSAPPPGEARFPIAPASVSPVPAATAERIPAAAGPTAQPQADRYLDGSPPQLSRCSIPPRFLPRRRRPPPRPRRGSHQVGSSGSPATG